MEQGIALYLGNILTPKASLRMDFRKQLHSWAVY